MYDSILVPTDGSEVAKAAVAHAVDLATTYDAALHTLYVISITDADDVDSPDILASLEPVGERAIHRVIHSAHEADVDTIEGMVATGPPYRAILEYADEHDIDLIVMGTHGRTGVHRYLLGSVAEKVLRMADVPVLAVPPLETE